MLSCVACFRFLGDLFLSEEEETPVWPNEAEKPAVAIRHPGKLLTPHVLTQHSLAPARAICPSTHVWEPPEGSQHVWGHPIVVVHASVSSPPGLHNPSKGEGRPLDIREGCTDSSTLSSRFPVAACLHNRSSGSQTSLSSFPYSIALTGLEVKPSWERLHSICPEVSAALSVLPSKCW